MLNYDGRSLVADTSGLARGIEQALRGQKEKQRQDEVNTLVSSVEEGGKISDKNMARLFQLDPNMGRFMQGVMARNDAQEQARIEQQAKKTIAFFAPAQRMTSDREKNDYLMMQARKVSKSGASPEEIKEEIAEIQEYMNMPLDQFKMAALQDSIAAGDMGALTRGAKDARTTLQKNYQAAVEGGFEGSIMDYQTAVKKAGASNTTVNVNPEGRQAPTKTNASKIQQDVLKAQTALKDLHKVADTHSDEFLTTWGRIKAGLGSALDKMNSDAGGLADFNAQRTQFSNAAKQMFNQYRKEITGAAASEKEMKDLLESMFNDDQGPKEFKASFDLFMEKAEENLRMAQQNATQGIDIEGRNEVPAGAPASDADLFKKYGIE